MDLGYFRYRVSSARLDLGVSAACFCANQDKKSGSQLTGKAGSGDIGNAKHEKLEVTSEGCCTHSDKKIRL